MSEGGNMKKVMMAAVVGAVLFMGTAGSVTTAGAAGNDGEVTGTILDSVHGKPIKGGCFTLWTPTSAVTVGTDAAGHYDATNLPVGFFEASGGDCSVKPKYAPVVYDAHPGLDGNQDSVQYVNVLGGGVPTTGINFVLARGAAIKLKLTDSVTGKPVVGATVCPDVASADVGGHAYQSGFCGNTDSKGKVTLTALVAGPTKVWADAQNYLFSYYNGHPDFASGDTIPLTAGRTTSVAMTLVHS